MDEETFEDVAPVIPDDEEPSRYIGRVYHLDANRINTKQKDQHVNEIEKWAKNGIIDLDMSEPAYSEAERGSKQREEKTSEYIFVEAVDCLGGENECRKTIEDILFHSGAKDSNQKKHGV